MFDYNRLNERDRPYARPIIDCFDRHSIRVSMIGNVLFGIPSSSVDLLAMGQEQDITRAITEVETLQQENPEFSIHRYRKIPSWGEIPLDGRVAIRNGPTVIDMAIKNQPSFI